MKKLIWIIIAVLVIGGIVYSSNKKEVVENGDDVIKIGIIAPLTGDMAFAGEAMREGAQLAIDQLGDTKHKYEIVVEDDGFDPKRSASAAGKLIGTDKVDALMTLYSGPGNTVAPIAEENKVVHFGIASDSNIAKGEYSFLHWTPPSEEVKTMVKALQARDIKNVSVLAVNQQGMQAIFTDFKNSIANTDIKIAAEESFNPGTKDFKTLIAKAEAANPDAYLLLAFSPEIEIIATQMKELEIDTPATSIESFEYSTEPGLFEGMWYVNAGDASGQFTSDYQAKFNKAPSVGAGNSYDIVKMIAWAAESSEEIPTTEQIKDKLMTLKDYQGAMGTLTADSTGIILSPAVVRMIKDGKPVTIAE